MRLHREHRISLTTVSLSGKAKISDSCSRSALTLLHVTTFRALIRVWRLFRRTKGRALAISTKDDYASKERNSARS